MIVARNLVKSFDRHPVLLGLDLVVEPGAVTLMAGANGAGKTTTLRLLAGLADPDAGTIAINGHDLRRTRSAALACLSFLPQAPRFHPRLTTRQVLEFHGQLRGRSRAEISRVLDTWGLLEYTGVPTAKLSGGLRQRLAIALFALADAPVLLLDEPGLSLDPEWRQNLQEFLTHQARCGRTVLMATHLLGEWEGRVDRCVLIERGRANGEIPPDRLREVFLRSSAVSEQNLVDFVSA